METELKLLINPADVGTFKEHALLKQHASEHPHLQDLASTYFDTPDLFLKRHGASLRVRHINGEGWIQTLKGGGIPLAGLYQREEWEATLPDASPDLTAFAKLTENDPRWSKLLTPGLLSRKLVPLFTTHVKRTTWMLQLAEGDAVELALDQGKVEHEQSEMPINEVEMELKAGDPSHLFDFALALQHEVPMQLSHLSKFERGFALCIPQPPSIVKAARIQLSRNMTVEQGLRAILHNCLAHIEGNAEGVVQIQDAESIHQMRVGLRRLHSALALFEDVAPCPEELQSEFKWLGNELGAARDWEVLANHTFSGIAQELRGSPVQAGLASLHTAVREVASAKCGAAAKAVSSARYASLMLSFRSWIMGCRWRDAPAGIQLDILDSPVKPFADSALRSKYRKLLKRGKGLAKLDTPSRHKARIAAKRMRYASEFFQSLYKPARVEAAIRSLSSLQDTLGKLNDANVAAELLTQERPENQAELPAASAFVQGYLTCRSRQELGKLGKTWKRFRKALPVYQGASRRA